MLEAACEAFAATLPPAAGFSVSVVNARGDACTISRGSDGHGGRWHSGTLVPVWSTGKGPAAAATLVLLEKHGLDLAAPVGEVWPEFRHEVTFGQLLAHQAGLAAPAAECSVFDHAAVAELLAHQDPNWLPGTKHGYHPRTFGFLLDEIALRLERKRLGAFFRETFALPAALDVHLGLPREEFARVAKVQTAKPRPRPEEQAFVREYMRAGSLTRRAFDGLKGLNGLFEFNRPEAWELGNPAFCGVASAEGLARFYHLLISRDSPFSPTVRRQAETALTAGEDEILRQASCFTAGFQKDPVDATGQKQRQHFGPSQRAFGHPGAGGSVALADPETGVAVAVVLNYLEPGLFPNKEIQAIVHAALAS